MERKLAHLVRRRHGGRRVRVRGLAKVTADFNLVAAAANLARLGVPGLHWTGPLGSSVSDPPTTYPGQRWTTSTPTGSARLGSPACCRAAGSMPDCPAATIQ